MEKLKRLRKHFGYTHNQLAVALGVSNRSIQTWEHGAGKPSPENMEKLLKLFPQLADEEGDR